MEIPYFKKFNLIAETMIFLLVFISVLLTHAFPAILHGIIRVIFIKCKSSPFISLHSEENQLSVCGPSVVLSSSLNAMCSMLINKPVTMVS